MAAITDLSEDEAYLYAILTDPSGIDQAEFTFVDEENDDGCWRAWPFQWRWFSSEDTLQIDQGSRSCGKSTSIKLRAFAFPFVHPGAEMVITAPELVHLLPIIGLIERHFLSTRLGLELLPNVRGNGITHRPFEMAFRNGARILGRIPQRDGRGIKGCVGPESLVLTKRGWVEAQDVTDQDHVWSHERRWAPVLYVEEIEDERLEVSGQGSLPILVNARHRIYGRQNRATVKQKRELGPLGWCSADQLDGFYWASPTEFPASEAIPFVLPDSMSEDVLNEEFWQMVGRYLAGLVAQDTPDAVALWLAEHFGATVPLREIPAFVYFLDGELRAALLEGYRSGGFPRWTPRKLSLGLGVLSQSLGASVGYSQKTSSAWRTRSHDDGLAWNGEGYGCYLIRKVVPRGPGKLINIVSQDHSYVANGIVHHNTHPLWLELDEACFPAGTLILTRRGLVEIQQVTCSDKVWTHRNRWRPVLGVHARGVRETVKVVGQGLPSLQMTPNHRLWAQGAKHWKRGGEGWEWRRADEMAGSYWSSPLNVQTEGPPSIPLSPTGVKRSVDPLDPDFLFLIGLWIAEGSVSSSNKTGDIHRATWSVTPDEAVMVQKLLAGLGLKASIWKVQNTAGCVNVVLNHSMVARWLADQCGKGAHAKQVPPWVMGLSANLRQQVLDGLIYGDGFMCKDSRYVPGRWKLTTVSRRLLVGSRILAQSLGYYVSAYETPPKDRTIRGKTVHGGVAYQIVGTMAGQGFDQDNLRLTKVRKVLPSAQVEVFDLTVAEDSSFVADGVVVHNSDYPEPGWIEIMETLKRGHVGAIWRAHGVTRGVRDYFWKLTQPESGWTVHHYPAMWRPTWSDQERDEKIANYGSRDNPDYRRNIMGMHGDSTSPLFVLARLMQCALAGTLVQTPQGAVRIEYLRPGDEILSAVGVSRIVAARTSWRDHVIKVGLDNGERVYVSPEHPFFTGRGWCHADLLVPGDELITQREAVRGVWGDVCRPQQAVLWAELHREVAWADLPGLGYGQADLAQLRMVRNRVLPGLETGPLLLSDMCGPMERRAGQAPGRPALRMVQGGFRSTESDKSVLYDGLPDGVGKFSASEAPQGTEGDALEQGGAWRAAGPPVHAVAGTGGRVATAVLGQPARCVGRGNRVLHDRLGAAVAEDSGRGGWPESSVSGREGSDQGRVADRPRVVGVEVLQRGGAEFARLSGGADQLCLYDLTVVGHPSFAVGKEGVLTHNCVDKEQSSDYNVKEYANIRITNEMINDVGGNIDYFLDFPGIHKKYSIFWVGMDVGYTIAPSEIVVLAEIPGVNGPTLKLLTRINMTRVGHDDQVLAIREVCRAYRPKAFSMDKGGNGLPLFQQLQNIDAQMAELIKGYNFGGKILVDLDKTVVVDEFLDDPIEKQGLIRNVKEYASDRLRELVDQERLILPWDKDLLSEMQGQTYVVVKDNINQYGVRNYSSGKFHALDALRFATLGYVQNPIETMVENAGKFESVPDIFVSFS